MVENTKIEWATHTLNWWTGCEAISPACQACYAASWAKRAGRDFAERILTTEANRKQALKWQRNAPAFFAEHGHRQRVFVNSLSDWADNQVPQEWRESLFAMIRSTPDLDYLLLTKRIGNALKMLPADWGDGYANVWLGATIANQAEADRDIPKLLATPARIRFLSCEPLLGPINLNFVRMPGAGFVSAVHGELHNGLEPDGLAPSVDWVIAGGESGIRARQWDIAWARSLRDQCAAAGVPFHWKQHGEWAPYDRGLTDSTLLATPGSTDYPMQRFGKKLAGRMIDGRIHNAFPTTAVKA